MSTPAPPPLPAGAPGSFRTTVHGTIFGERRILLDRVGPGTVLVLLPGPPLDDEPGVWVHLPGGEPIGHLPPEIEAWLAPWMRRGGKATARVIRASGTDVPSWRRLLIEVDCCG